jgi:hypothetical protein
LPVVFGEALAPVADDVREEGEDQGAFVVVEIGEVAVFQVGAVGMHDDPPVVIADPEIVFVFWSVTHGSELSPGGLACFGPGHAAGLFHGTIGRKDGVGGFGQAAAGLPLLVHEALLEGRQEVEVHGAHEKSHREKGGECDAKLQGFRRPALPESVRHRHLLGAV